MRQRKNIRNAGLLGLMLGAFLFCTPAAAAGGAVNLQYPYDGVTFTAYRVADAASEDGYVLSGAFSDYPVSIPGESWREAAETLAAYAARDQIEAVVQARVSGGEATFDALETGLYLVVGDTCVQDGICTPVPFLLDPSEGEPTRAYVKYDQDIGENSRTFCKVEKVWSGDAEESRPEQITVELLKNGTVYERAVLEETNNWSFTWRDLDAACRWQVTEQEVPTGYTVAVSQSGQSFTVTNTWQPPAEPENPPPSEGTEEPTNPGEESENVPMEPETPVGPALPQTGQRWWPLGILVPGGMGLLLIGIGKWSGKK